MSSDTTQRPRPARPITADDGAAAPLPLLEDAPRSLRLIDQLGLWGNLGVSLLGFTGAIFILSPIGPPISLLAAIVATVFGTLVGSLFVALSAVPGADTGAPTM